MQLACAWWHYSGPNRSIWHERLHSILSMIPTRISDVTDPSHHGQISADRRRASARMVEGSPPDAEFNGTVTTDSRGDAEQSGLTMHLSPILYSASARCEVIAVMKRPGRNPSWRRLGRGTVRGFVSLLGSNGGLKIESAKGANRERVGARELGARPFPRTAKATPNYWRTD